MPELSRRRKLLVLAICCMSLLIVSLDNTIVNVALPSIRLELNATVSGLQWTVDAYTLVLASLLMLSGSTGDRIGRRRMFQTGLVLFTLGSLLCSLAPSIGWLVVFRMIQAVGGSMLNPVAMSIITNTFRDPKERARAIGVWGAVIGISLSLGPIVGGALVESVGWRSIFWINIPIGVLALVLTALFVPESKAPRPRRLDPVGQLLVMLALATLTYSIIEGPNFGWGSARIIGLFAVFVITLMALLWHEPRRTDPLLDLRFFRSAPFSGATVIAICSFAALASFLFLNTLYLQDVRGLSALTAGLCTVPMAAMTLTFAPLSGRIVADRGPRLPLLIAGSAMTASALLLSGLANDTPFAVLIAAYLLFGLGFGMVNAPITVTAVSGMPRDQAGVAAGVASTSRQVGQTLGVAVVGISATAGVHGSLQSGFATASHLGWWIIVGCGLAVLLLGLFTTGRRALDSAALVAERLNNEELTASSPR
jgi:EmrB/QacA subfamily drug resistance transporter